jgi:choline dehydrogenase-like flavoprotein
MGQACKSHKAKLWAVDQPSMDLSPFADYDKDWAGLGNPSWKWRDVLPAFKALEDDTAPDTKIHGRDGPVTLSRTHPEVFSKLARAFVNSSMALGYRYAHDLNALDVEGRPTGKDWKPQNQHGERIY